VNAVRKGGDFLASYLLQWERIVEALRAGGPMPASVADGREAVRIVLAALRSSQEGNVVSMEGSAPGLLTEGIGK
jgi:predicted dehydrogenase